MLAWELHRVGARWLVESVRRDPATDAALPPAPQARASPEAVVTAALRALAANDAWQVTDEELFLEAVHLNEHGVTGSILLMERWRLDCCGSCSFLP